MKEFNGFRRGINLGGWLSQCDHTEETYNSFITEEDMKNISEWGLDHIRIPVDYELLEDEEGNYRESGFAHLDDGICWAVKYGLNVIIDLHKTYGFSFDVGENEEGFFENEAYQERFYRLWEKITGRFSGYEKKVAFELLNEVTDEKYCQPWNAIWKKCLQRIRKISKESAVLVGGYHNNSVEALKDLDVPEDDNVIYNFHCYEPLVFTHQGAYWIPVMDHDFRISIDKPASFLNAETERIFKAPMTGYCPEDEYLTSRYFDRLFAVACQIAEERNVALYCGEYGVIDLADARQTVKWYRMINETLEKYNIGRAAWNYRGKDFGFVDEHMKEVLPEMIKLL